MRRDIDVTRVGVPSLDQLQVLEAVVEAGSFSAAARSLNRTQSVISYTIANLEDQLGLQLFDRGQRRPLLTEAGTAILADARRVSATVQALRARAAGLQGGLEAEVALAVDVMFPTCRLVTALDDFAREFPTVSLRLHVEGLGAVAQLVLDRACVLGIAGWMAQQFEQLVRRRIGEVILIPVAAPTHRLARVAGTLPPDMVREETQLVLSDRSTLTRGQDFGVLSQRTWRLGDLGAKRALLLQGLGWGNMPEELVREDVDAGRLVRLNITDPEARRYAMLLISRNDTPPGIAGAWLADRLGRE